jgi:hypothetical protein
MTNRRTWSHREIKDPVYRNESCPTQKKMYPTRKRAKKHARLMRSQGYDLLSPYDCPFCGAIHLGHSSRRGF